MAVSTIQIQPCTTKPACVIRVTLTVYGHRWPLAGLVGVQAKTEDVRAVGKGNDGHFRNRARGLIEADCTKKRMDDRSES